MFAIQRTSASLRFDFGTAHGTKPLNQNIIIVNTLRFNTENKMKATKIVYIVIVMILIYSYKTNENDKKIISAESKFSPLSEKLIRKEFSGVILVAEDDSILFNKAYGLKNSHNNEANSLNTIFDIGSITKQFTGAGIMKLVMTNKISLDDQISKYFENVTDDKKNITIHQLLTHSSGLVDAVGDDYDSITEEEFLNKVFSTNLISPIGKEHHYSNVGYSLLSLIIEKTSGLNYEKYLNQEIFTPSLMNHTGYIIPDWNYSEISNGFLNGKETKKPNEENWSEQGPYLNLKGNGGILSRASDLLLWSKVIRKNKILDKESTEKYLYPHILEYDDGNSYYGYGWVIENNDKENKLIWHNGGNGIFFADMWMFPKKGITIIVLCNKYEEYVETIAEEFAKVLTD